MATSFVRVVGPSGSCSVCLTGIETVEEVQALLSNVCATGQAVIGFKDSENKVIGLSAAVKRPQLLDAATYEVVCQRVPTAPPMVAEPSAPPESMDEEEDVTDDVFAPALQALPPAQLAELSIMSFFSDNVLRTLAKCDVEVGFLDDWLLQNLDSAQLLQLRSSLLFRKDEVERDIIAVLSSTDVDMAAQWVAVLLKFAEADDESAASTESDEEFANSEEIYRPSAPTPQQDSFLQLIEQLYLSDAIDRSTWTRAGQEIRTNASPELSAWLSKCLSGSCNVSELLDFLRQTYASEQSDANGSAPRGRERTARASTSAGAASAHLDGELRSFIALAAQTEAVSEDMAAELIRLAPQLVQSAEVMQSVRAVKLGQSTLQHAIGQLLRRYLACVKEAELQGVLLRHLRQLCSRFGIQKVNERALVNDATLTSSLYASFATGDGEAVQRLLQLLRCAEMARELSHACTTARGGADASPPTPAGLCALIAALVEAHALAADESSALQSYVRSSDGKARVYDALRVYAHDGSLDELIDTLQVLSQRAQQALEEAQLQEEARRLSAIPSHALVRAWEGAGGEGDASSSERGVRELLQHCLAARLIDSSTHAVLEGKVRDPRLRAIAAVYGRTADVQDAAQSLGRLADVVAQEASDSDSGAGAPSSPHVGDTLPPTATCPLLRAAAAYLLAAHHTQALAAMAVYAQAQDDAELYDTLARIARRVHEACGGAAGECFDASGEELRPCAAVRICAGGGLGLPSAVVERLCEGSDDDGAVLAVLLSHLHGVALSDVRRALSDCFALRSVQALQANGSLTLSQYRYVTKLYNRPEVQAAVQAFLTDLDESAFGSALRVIVNTLDV